MILSFVFVHSPKETTLENVYFWVSLVFLLSRIIFVLLNAAAINDEAKKPVQVLRSIPEGHYHEEVF